MTESFDSVNPLLRKKGSWPGRQTNKNYSPIKVPFCLLRWGTRKNGQNCFVYYLIHSWRCGVLRWYRLTLRFRVTLEKLWLITCHDVWKQVWFLYKPFYDITANVPPAVHLLLNEVFQDHFAHDFVTSNSTSKISVTVSFLVFSKSALNRMLRCPTILTISTAFRIFLSVLAVRSRPTRSSTSCRHSKNRLCHSTTSARELSFNTFFISSKQLSVERLF